MVDWFRKKYKSDNDIIEPNIPQTGLKLPVLRSRSRPEPYFLAGAEIISYFRLRLQKIPYKNDFITTIFFQIMVFS